jgi:multiple sugar transport system substrate-binding protein
MASKRISRRSFLKSAAVGSAGILLAACTPAQETTNEAQAPAGEQPAEEQPEGAAPAGEAVTLKVLAENWGEVYNNLMMVIGDEFTEENPDLKVEWEFDPEWRTKLTTLFAANTPPDLCFMRPDFLASVAPKGVLLPLDNYLAEAGAKREDFVLAMYDSGVYDGKLYGMPGGADYWDLFYSKTIFKDVELDPESPPTTIPEFDEYSKKVITYDADGNIERAAMMYSTGWLPQWMYVFGGELYDETSQKITANHPKNVEALTWLRDYFQSMGDIDKLTAFAQRPGFFEAGNPFATKQCAFLFDGFWYYEAIDQHAPDLEYGVTFWPTPTGSEEERQNWMLGGWHYSLAKGIPNPDQSWEFMRYMFWDKSAKMGIDTLNGTCVQSQLDDWVEGMQAKLGSDNRMTPYLHFFTDTGEHATKYFPIIPNQSFYSDELGRVYDLVVRNQMEPQAALDEVTTNVQADLDKVNSGG